MKAFMDEEFLLDTECAKKLYHDFAESMPILDYHCHISPKKLQKTSVLKILQKHGFGGSL